LVTVPGVGRKTANVVLSVGFDRAGLPVDTHVGRLSRLLGLTTETDPVKVELELNEFVPPAERGKLSLRLILHGRKVCIARRRRFTALFRGDRVFAALRRACARRRTGLGPASRRRSRRCAQPVW